jgi:diguanylate cyclase (GGDEF)-like protein
VRVLLAEGDAAEAARVGALLVDSTAAVLRVTSVRTLRESVSVLAADATDLMLVNLVLPDATGPRILETIRQAAPHVAVVVLTENVDRDLGLAAVRLGACGYMVKGESEGPGLVRQILHALELRRIMADLEQEQRRAAHKATHDALTGLPNRALLLDRLTQAIEASKRTERSLAVMFVDLDGFKQLNDALGHSCGDELLRNVATRIRQTLRATDTVARLGGDEFVLVCTNLCSADDACVVAQKVAEGLREPVALMGRKWTIGASVGVAVSGSDACTPAELLRRADLAMYSAKDAGGHAFAMYRSELEQWPTQLGSQRRLART